jgi:hypothetical protein
MALIQGEETVRARPSGKNDERCVRETYPKIPVSPDHLGRLLYVLGAETFQSIRASRDLAEEKELSDGTNPIQKEVVHLRGNERR